MSNSIESPSRLKRSLEASTKRRTKMTRRDLRIRSSNLSLIQPIVLSHSKVLRRSSNKRSMTRIVRILNLRAKLVS